MDGPFISLCMFYCDLSNTKCSYTLVLNLFNTRKGAGENFSLAKVMNLMIFFFILRYSFKFGCVYCVAVLLVRTTNEYLF